MANKFIILFLCTVCCLVTSYANTPPPQTKPALAQACPAPTEEMLRCLSQYACQHAIRLDLRCLLNLSGTPLLGGLLGGTGGGLLGGGGGGPGGGTGIVGGLLGR